MEDQLESQPGSKPTDPPAKPAGKSAKVDRLLTLGGFGKRYTLCQRAAQRVRRRVETRVSANPSSISPVTASLIDEVTRYEIARLITQKDLRRPELSLAQTTELMGLYLRYAARRDCALRKLFGGQNADRDRREKLMGFYAQPSVSGAGDLVDEFPADDSAAADLDGIGEGEGDVLQATEPGDRMARLQILYSRPVLSAGDDPPQQPASGPQASRGSRLAPGRPRTPPVPGNAAEGRTQDEVVQW